MAAVVPFPELLRAAAPAHVTPLALEHDTVTALAGGVLQPEKFGVTAFTCTVKAAGLAVVLKETVVVAGTPVTLKSGLLEVKMTELGVTLKLLTVAYRGKSPKARAVAATIVSRLTYICLSLFPI